jgi:hypothetical protein
LKWFRRIVIALFVIFVVIQVVRPDMKNPPVDPKHTLESTGQVTPQAESILRRSCYDCHSSETVWPWYAKIAPVSWFLADHVKDGRKELNFSEWSTFNARRKARKLKEVCDQVREGEMPLKTYLPLHPAAKLSDADRETLCSWARQQTAALGPLPPPTEEEKRRAAERAPQ